MSTAATAGVAAERDRKDIAVEIEGVWKIFGARACEALAAVRVSNREEVHLHLYGKADVRAGRKMVHVTRCCQSAL